MITDNKFLVFGNLALGFLHDLAWTNFIVDNRLKYRKKYFLSYEDEFICFLFAMNIAHLISGLTIYSNFEKKMENYQAYLLANGLSCVVVITLSILADKVNFIAKGVLILGGAVYLLVSFIAKSSHRRSFFSSW